MALNAQVSQAATVTVTGRRERRSVGYPGPGCGYGCRRPGWAGCGTGWTGCSTVREGPEKACGSGRGDRPANQSRASCPHSMTTPIATTSGSRPDTKVAVNSISTATTLSPIRAPWCRLSVKTASTAPAAARPPVSSTVARSRDSTVSTSIPSPLPGGVVSASRTVSRISTERIRGIESSMVKMSSTQLTSASPLPIVTWRGRGATAPSESVIAVRPCRNSTMRAKMPRREPGGAGSYADPHSSRCTGPTYG